MNQDETIALFRQGKQAWNQWAEAMLAERKAMEADGRWMVERDVLDSLRPQNAETTDWIASASIDFSALSLEARTLADADARSSENKEERASSSARPLKQLVVEGESIDFQGWVFPCSANFLKTQFRGPAEFGAAEFHETAEFGQTKFHGEGSFREAQFHGSAAFGGAHFHARAGFEAVQFHKRTWLGEAQFYGQAVFKAVQSHGEIWFRDGEFHGDAFFEKAQFYGKARFDYAKFHKWALFDATQFHDEAGFWDSDFKGTAWFSDARFRREAIFRQVTFRMFAEFQRSHFVGQAIFNAIRGERAFDLAEAQFELVPDFIQAHFEEAPRLDNVKVFGRMIEPPAAQPSLTPVTPVSVREKLKRLWARQRNYPRRFGGGVRRRVLRAEGDMPARWRALKRVAIQGHDGDREHEFFAREIRSARFVTDWPLPWPFWMGRAWTAFARFWFGILYGLFADHGRSTVLPLLWWTLIVLIATAFYLGEHPSVASDRALLRQQGYGSASSWIGSTYHAAWAFPEACHEPANPPPSPSVRPTAPQNTNAPNEAFQLALRTGLIAFDPGPESTLRTYRCLYGLEEVGGKPVPIISWAVSNMIIGQKLFSAVMIFLFGLALRNMLKMK